MVPLKTELRERETYRDKPECKATIWGPLSPPGWLGSLLFCVCPSSGKAELKKTQLPPCQKERKGGPTTAVSAVKYICCPHAKGRKLWPDTRRPVAASTWGLWRLEDCKAICRNTFCGLKKTWVTCSSLILRHNFSTPCYYFWNGDVFYNQRGLMMG